MEILKKHKHLVIASAVFAGLYALISLVNHYYFRTYSLDLGLYTNAAYKYAHLQLADSGMIKEWTEPILGGHFDVYLILFSPLTYLFGTYTLLIVQILAVIFGGIGVYRYFELIGSKNSKIPIFATVYFYIFFGVIGAISYDYHSVVVASCIVPWFFAAVYSNKKELSAVLLAVMLLSQENVSLWLFFVCLGLAIEYRHDLRRVYYMLMLASISILYFVAVISIVIPSFSAHEAYGGFLYSSLGDNALEAIKTILSHPVDSFMMLFTNHNDTPHGDFVKAELHIILLVSGLPLLLKKPQYILMLVPIYFQKLYHDNFLMWGIGYQYNIEFAPILAIGIFAVISDIKRPRLSRFLAVLLVLLATASTFRTMDNTVSFTDKSRIRVYKKSHYQRDYDVKRAHELLKKIPKEARVSAQPPFVPHLSLRQSIYQFPIVKDAEYIVYSQKESSYPLTDEEFELKIHELEQSKAWEVLYEGDIRVLKRIHD